LRALADVPSVVKSITGVAGTNERLLCREYNSQTLFSLDIAAGQNITVLITVAS